MCYVDLISRWWIDIHSNYMHATNGGAIMKHIENDPTPGEPNHWYRKISNISRAKSPNLNVSRLVLQMSLPNPTKPGVKSRMKM